jgi:pyrimidine-specific ribonucleoside hydrolase
VRTVVRLWIDTDVGDDPDDAIALLCAARCPTVDLVGVSTVDDDLDRRVREATALVEAPVCRGDDPGLAASIAEARADRLLAIGPLTNLARLLEAGAAVPPVTLMGGLLGSVRHWGFMMDVEHNFSRDPAAAAAVVSACHPVVVPLNVTLALRLDGDELASLLHAAPELEHGVRAFFDLQRDFGVPAEERSIVLHDPLAFLAVARPELVPLGELTVTVDGRGRLTEAAGGAAIRMPGRVDAKRCIDIVLGLVSRNVG